MVPPPVMVGVPRVNTETALVDEFDKSMPGLTRRNRDFKKSGATSRVPAMVVVEPLVPMARAPPRELMAESSQLLHRTLLQETVPVV